MLSQKYLERLLKSPTESIKKQREDYKEANSRSLEGFPIPMDVLPIPQVSRQGNSVIYGYMSLTMEYKPITKLFTKLNAQPNPNPKKKAQAAEYDATYQTLAASVHNELSTWPICPLSPKCNKPMGKHIPNIIIHLPIKSYPHDHFGPMSLPVIVVEIEGGKNVWGFNEETYKGLMAAFQILSYTHITYFIQVLQYSVAIHTLKRNPTASKVDIKYESINFTGNIGKSLVLLSKIIVQILMKIYIEVVPKLPMFVKYFCKNELVTRGSVNRYPFAPICCEDCFHISSYEILSGVMYHDKCEAFVLNLYNQVEGILLYYDLSKQGHQGLNYHMICGNDNCAPTQAEHLWLDFHTDGDAKAPFYRVSEGVFMFWLTRPVGNLVALVYKDEQIEAICIMKEKPIMHLGIGPAQASRSEMSAYAKSHPEIANNEYKFPLDYTSALDTEENIYY